jgi:hypothetical protein
MHLIEPYYNWRNHYISNEDSRSPFYGRENSEMFYTDHIYDHYIHPQWDNIGSPTLFIKILFADYEDGFCIIEMIGEWNDCINNDIMTFKRDVIEPLMCEGISKFILIGENVLNFHESDDCYYEEWFDEVEDMDGWIALLNFREHVIEVFEEANIDSYFVLGGKMNNLGWRTLTPTSLFNKVKGFVMRRLGTGGDYNGF